MMYIKLLSVDEKNTGLSINASSPKKSDGVVAHTLRYSTSYKTVREHTHLFLLQEILAVTIMDPSSKNLESVMEDSEKTEVSKNQKLEMAKKATLDYVTKL